jgi:hypothetical protein
MPQLPIAFLMPGRHKSSSFENIVDGPGIVCQTRQMKKQDKV